MEFLLFALLEVEEFSSVQHHICIRISIRLEVCGICFPIVGSNGGFFIIIIFFLEKLVSTVWMQLRLVVKVWKKIFKIRFLTCSKFGTRSPKI